MEQRQHKPYYERKAEKAVHVLLDELVSVRNVKDWAKRADVPESTLYKMAVLTFDKTPKDILSEVKFEKVRLEIKKDIEACAYSIAIDAGFGSEDSLRMFLRRRYDTNVTAIRRQILSENHHMDWRWLNGTE